MSLFSNIKRMFGLDNDSELEIDEIESIPESFSTNDAAPAVTAEIPEVDTVQAQAIFRRVLEVFNGALPGFIAKSVDPQKQEKLLYDALDQSLKDYLESLNQAALASCQLAWGAERDKMKEEADELRRKAQELEEKRSELNDRQLSSERQKRALTERVRDLENQVLTLEANREQLELENKCMINKAKAAAVLEGDYACLAETQTMLNAAKEEAEAYAKEISSLKEELASMSQQLAAVGADGEEKEKAFVSLKESVAALAKENEDLKSEVAEKDALLHGKEQLLQEKDAQLHNAVSEEQLKSVMEQVNLFEEVKAKMDAHISRLKESLKASQAENESLRKTIKKNMLEHHALQDQLHNEIETLKNGMAVTTEDSAAYQTGEDAASPAKKKRAKRSSALSNDDDIEDLISGANWLVSTPPEDTSMRSLAEDDSFGYQPPQKKTRTVHHDAQLSLFD